ncbi:MAG: single-stranded DNA-binding protein [Anaerolineales bacterium]
MSYQKLTIVGNLGRDPEMRYTPTGQAVTSFSVATNRQYTNSNGEKIKETVWFRVSAWGRQAEICNQFLKSGKQVLIEGRITADKTTGGPRIWTRQDGSSGASFDVNAERVVFLGRADGADGSAAADAYQGAPSEPDAAVEDEIPF